MSEVLLAAGELFAEDLIPNVCKPGHMFITSGITGLTCTAGNH